MVHSDDSGSDSNSNNDDDGGDSGPSFSDPVVTNPDRVPDFRDVDEDDKGKTLSEVQDENNSGGDSGGDIDNNDSGGGGSDSTAVVVTENQDGEQVTVGQGTDTEAARIDAATNENFDAAQGEEVDAFESALDSGQGDGTEPEVITGQQTQATQQKQDTRNNQRSDPGLFENAQETFIDSQRPPIQDLGGSQGFTRTATASELRDTGAQENLGQIIKRQTQPITQNLPDTNFVQRTPQNNFLDQDQVNSQFTPDSPTVITEVGQEQPGGTNIPGRNFANENAPREFVGLPSPDFNSGQTGQQVKQDVENVVGNEQFAESIGVAAAAGSQAFEGVANLPRFSQQLVNNPLQTAEQTRKSIKRTVDATGERRELDSAQDFETQAETNTLILGALAGPTASVATGPTVTGVTNAGGLTQAAARASGVTDAKRAKDFVLRRDEDTGRIVFNNPQTDSQGSQAPNDFVVEDSGKAPDQKQQFRDQPQQRRGSGPIDNPDKGVKRSEAEVLIGRELRPEDIRQEGPEGGIREVFTPQKRFQSGGDVKPRNRQTLSVQSLREQAKDILQSERKGSAQGLVSKQDTTGKGFGDGKADNTNIPARNQRPDSDNTRSDTGNLVDDFRQNNRRRSDRDTDSDSDRTQSDFGAESVRNTLAVNQDLGLGQDTNTVSDLDQDLGQDQDQGQGQDDFVDNDTGQDTRQNTDQGFGNGFDDVVSDPPEVFERPRRRRQEDDNTRRRRDRDFDLDFGDENNQPQRNQDNTQRSVSESPSAAPSVDAILLGDTTEEEVEDDKVFSGLETRSVSDTFDFKL